MDEVVYCVCECLHLNRCGEEEKTFLVIKMGRKKCRSNDKRCLSIVSFSSEEVEVDVGQTKRGRTNRWTKNQTDKNKDHFKRPYFGMRQKIEGVKKQLCTKMEKSQLHLTTKG